MTAAPPTEIAGDLFARKGRAAPLGADVAAEPPPARLPAPPLTDLFGEPVSAADYETAAEGTPGDGDEPPPAASLLFILGQRSAAIDADEPKVRDDVPLPTAELPAPETAERATGTPEPTAVITDDAEAAATEKTDPVDSAPITTGPAPLPVPVVAGLPVPVTVAEPPRRRFPVATAPGMALALAGALLAVHLGRATDSAPTPPPVAADAPAAPGPVTPAAVNADTEPSSGRIETEIETVRIGASGKADIQGRAAPGADLVILHNGNPLGAVRADDAGAWRLEARVPLIETQHEFSVVSVQADSLIVVSGPVPKPETGSAIPAPARKPLMPSRYSIQIASLPTAADARREASKLAAKLSGIVGRERMEIRDATIDRGRTVFRVTVGGFAQRDAAEELCTRIRARNETCLVMRRR